MSPIKVVQNRRACQNKEWMPKIKSQHVRGLMNHVHVQERDSPNQACFKDANPSYGRTYSVT
jgi:hypothetical protein